MAQELMISQEDADERRRRRDEARASLACAGLYLTLQEESFFEQLDEEDLTVEECAERVLEFTRARRRHQFPASTI